MSKLPWGWEKVNLCVSWPKSKKNRVYSQYRRQVLALKESRPRGVSLKKHMANESSKGNANADKWLTNKGLA